MKTLPLMLVLGLTSAVYANEESSSKNNEISELSALGAGLTASGATVWHIDSKINERKEVRAKIDKERTFIITPQKDSKGNLLLDSKPFQSEKDIDSALVKANKFDVVRVTYILDPRTAQMEYLDDMETRLKNVDRELANINRSLKAYDDMNQINPRNLNQAVQKQNELMNKKIATEMKKKMIREAMEEIQTLSPETFVKKYQKDILRISEFSMNNDHQFNKLNDILEDSSNRKNRIISIDGRMNHMHYALKANSSKLVRNILGYVATPVLLGTSAAHAGETYTDIFDGEESTKDDFKDSSDETQRGSNVDNL